MVSTAAPANFVGTKSVPMKISFQWLQDLLPVKTSVEDAAAVLTATGLESKGWNRLRASRRIEGAGRG